MGWRFHRRLTIIPGVYLNFGKNGISTTLGPKGLSLNLGKNGIYLNTGFPGSGLSQRIKISGFKGANESELEDGNISEENSRQLSQFLDQTVDDPSQIKSAHIGELTSLGLQSLKNTIYTANKQFTEIDKELVNFEERHAFITRKHKKISTSFFRFLQKKKIGKLEEEIKGIEININEIKEQLELSKVDLAISHDETFAELFNNLNQSYFRLMSTHKIWDITHRKDIDRIKMRSVAENEIRRTDVRASVERCTLINSKTTPLKLSNVNGGDLFFYPGFLLVYNSEHSFAIIDYSELEVDGYQYNIVENESVPKDSEIISYTWYKCNKDGTPDKRFKDNFQIPILKYNAISFKSRSGLNELFLFSNSGNADFFKSLLKEYCSAISIANSMLNEFKQ